MKINETRSPTVETLKEYNALVHATVSKNGKENKHSDDFSTFMHATIRGIVSSIKQEMSEMHHDLSAILHEPQSKASQATLKAVLRRQKNFLWRMSVELADFMWRHRQYATIFAIGTYFNSYFAVLILMCQLYLVIGTMARPVVRISEKMLYKSLIVGMRFIRKLLQLPFDIPQLLLTLSRRKRLELTEDEIEQITRDARKTLKAMSVVKAKNLK